MALRLVRPQIALVPYIAGAVILGAFYFLHYPIPGFWPRLGQAGAAVLGVALCAGVGGAVWRLFQWPEAESSLERALFRVGAGLPVLSLSLLLWGVLGFYAPAAIGLLLAGLAVFCWEDVRALASSAGAWRADGGGWGRAAGGLGVFALALTALCAFAPPSYYDSLVYHLALPAKYLQEGRVGFVAYNQYAHFPQNMEMIYGAFLALSGDVSSQLFNTLLSALTAVLMATAGRRWVSGLRWDLLLFVTAPCSVLLSSETYVEAPMAFAVSLSVLAASRALSTDDRRWWAAAGWMAGFAAGVKYTGVMTPLILGGFCLLWPRRRILRERLGDFAAVGGISFLLFLPWLVKNAVFTGGNPVFPFLPTFFPASNVHLPIETAQAYFQVLDEYKGSSNLLTELFLMPFRLATNSSSFGGGYDVTGDLGWALPMILFPAALALWKKEAGARFLWVYVAAHALLWACARPVLRFLFPIFPLVCLLSGAGLAALLSMAPRGARWAVSAALIPFFLLNGVLFYGIESIRAPFAVATGWETREEYLLKKIDGYAAMAWAGENLPQDSRLFLFGDQRGYYMPRAYVAPMALLPSPLAEWADSAPDAESLRRELLKSGFTHVFFHVREAERLKGYRAFQMSPAGRARWEQMLLRVRPVYRDASVTIYELHG